MSVIFPVKKCLKQSQALSPLLLHSSLDLAIRRVQVDRNRFKLNGIYKFLVCADNINIFGGSVHTIKKETDA